MGGQADGTTAGLDFDREPPWGPHDRYADAEKARLVAARSAWAAIEGQGERVTENEQGGRRTCACVRACMRAGKS